MVHELCPICGNKIYEEDGYYICDTCGWTEQIYVHDCKIAYGEYD